MATTKVLTLLAWLLPLVGITLSLAVELRARRRVARGAGAHRPGPPHHEPTPEPRDHGAGPAGDWPSGQ